MQSVQDLTVADQTSPAQYQLTLADPDQAELNDWTARLMGKLEDIPELRDVATRSGRLTVKSMLTAVLPRCEFLEAHF